MIETESRHICRDCEHFQPKLNETITERDKSGGVCRAPLGLVNGIRYLNSGCLNPQYFKAIEESVEN